MEVFQYNNQNNLGVIKGSNLCCEITIYNDENEYGVCFLSSICLPKFVVDCYTEEDLNTDESNRRQSGASLHLVLIVQPVQQR